MKICLLTYLYLQGSFVADTCYEELMNNYITQKVFISGYKDNIKLMKICRKTGRDKIITIKEDQKFIR